VIWTRERIEKVYFKVQIVNSTLHFRERRQKKVKSVSTAGVSM
jgi:hypothetical protein